MKGIGGKREDVWQPQQIQTISSWKDEQAMCSFRRERPGCRPMEHVIVNPIFVENPSWAMAAMVSVQSIVLFGISKLWWSERDGSWNA